ncbi:sterol desaturase family protein [Acaryochloris sp. IP29b_bin.137]|uniref:sterol desaturase family protein n=1 Tax=Acaryochloris sp. IP29b_bin.137 TaxID=2969217 RepID=UPI00260A5FC6|nr:sterol desaturase family protein [Acaryochloris sp. IP29b_bin.137]
MRGLTPALEFTKYIVTSFAIYGCFFMVERIRPVESDQPRSHLWFNLRWFVLYSLIVFGFQAIGISILVPTIRDSLGGSLIDLQAPHNSWSVLLLSLLYLFLVDFFYYWFHRLQHTSSFLWEQHKLHHSELSLNVTSTRRVHWLEEPLVLIFLGLPLGILIQFNGLPLGVLSLIEILWLQFIHMNLRLHLGTASRIITGPQYHRIHHSFKVEHLDKNFSAFFPLWDIFFGTYYHPQKNEFPATGLNNKEDYNNIFVAFFLPFKGWISSKHKHTRISKTKGGLVRKE